MYYVTCDGFPLLDWRDDDLILTSPRVKLEVNTVGEGSFTIYKNHPHYDKLKKLKSVFEVSDETGVIFRGRATGDTIDFDHGMAVDLEGAMAFFNDSVVRPFHFPDDFKENADYITAAESGNVIEFFLGWLIDNHNSQVEDFQKMKLGNVTVSDPNNYITRSSSGYSSTWEALKAKLFDSSLEGYLCIRYEADGNYIDYISDFTETNSQEIAFGENILDLKNFTEASGTYSAIIPLGAAGITIEGLADGDITDDLVKSGDTIYSRNAVAEYGWVYAPTSETTWEDVTNDSNLLTKGAEWLANGGMLFDHGVEVTAVDLHFTDAQIESLRICKNVNVYSGPHGLAESFPLSKLEIELLNPQNTKITVGKTVIPLTERVGIKQDETENKFSKISKTQDEIRLEVVNKTKELQSTFVQTTKQFSLTVEDLKNKVNGSLVLDANGFIVTTAGESVTISGGQIDASKINTADLDASKINVGDMNLTGAITWGDFSSEAQDELLEETTQAAKNDITQTVVPGLEDRIQASKDRADSAYDLAWDAESLANNAVDIAGDAYALAEETSDEFASVKKTSGGKTYIDGSKIYSNSIYADAMHLGGSMTVYSSKTGTTVGGYLGYTTSANDNSAGMHMQKGNGEVVVTNNGAKMTYGGSTNQVYVSASAAALVVGSSNVYINDSQVRLNNGSYALYLSGSAFYPTSSGSVTLGTSSYKWGQGYATASTFSTSDRNEKNSIEDLPVKYLDLFDRLRPVRFKFNDGTSGRFHVGFIAQDVEDSMAAAAIDSQEFGGFGKDIHEETGADIYMLRYEEFVGILAAKLQEVDKRVKILEGIA